MNNTELEEAAQASGNPHTDTGDSGTQSAANLGKIVAPIRLRIEDEQNAMEKARIEKEQLAARRAAERKARAEAGRQRFWHD